MMRTLLVRGMLVGIVAGLLAFGFARVFGEPQVDHAIAFESQQAQAAGAAEEPELVSRGVQANLGLFVAVIVYSSAFGGLFALVFAYAYGRVPLGDPRVLAGLLALAGFVTIVLVPSLKYPANPPSVGDPETISYRTGLFFLMLAISLAAAGVALWTRGRFIRSHGGWTASLIGAALFLAIVFAAMLLLPAINEVPERFPAVLLWRFRVASLGTQIVMWTTIGLLFGALSRRSLPSRSF